MERALLSKGFAVFSKNQERIYAEVSEEIATDGFSVSNGLGSDCACATFASSVLALFARALDLPIKKETSLENDGELVMQIMSSLEDEGWSSEFHLLQDDGLWPLICCGSIDEESGELIEMFKERVFDSKHFGTQGIAAFIEANSLSNSIRKENTTKCLLHSFPNMSCTLSELDEFADRIGYLFSVDLTDAYVYHTKKKFSRQMKIDSLLLENIKVGNPFYEILPTLIWWEENELRIVAFAERQYDGFSYDLDETDFIRAFSFSYVLSLLYLNKLDKEVKNANRCGKNFPVFR